MTISYTPACKDCGGNELKFDAYAAWDDEKQDYSLIVAFGDDAYCESCQMIVDVSWGEHE